ncbi:DUF2232 domain-containing protein [Roseisolibacter agri]|uniref:DUF2232 domain-containing protein n=1 Tax=Roseisolibacter agri TaxID=2014610 RepID=A0AA37QH63_9BACT|nr:DUF2232 domain-containing protein [Roseisolibacter agri]GLC26355.1 hypothetical protein rosag_28680 [Roseisolibacter agri]
MAAAERGISPAARERGWGRTVVALLACLALAAAPLWPAAAGLIAAFVRVALPIEQTMLLVVPALAACAAVGWWAGGRIYLLLAWLALAAWVVMAPLPVQAPSYPSLARGWALLVAASFGIVGIVAPGRAFFSRALSSLGLALGVALVVLFATDRDPGRLSRVMTTEYQRRASASLDAWRDHAADDGWQSVAARSPELAERADGTAAGLEALPQYAAMLTPALVALESLAALALAWALYHRLSRTRLGPPLGALRTFRFNDQLVWGVVAGAAMLLVPSLAALRVVGANLLAFFGALYALRGLGVLRWWAPEKWAALAALGVALLLPVMGVTLLAGTLGVIALLLGLGDTWQDWRNRRPRPTA